MKGRNAVVLQSKDEKKKDLIFTRIDLKSKLIIYSTQSPLECSKSFLLSPKRINELEALLHITLYCMIT